MLNSHDPSFRAVSLALHVTDVVPTPKLLPDITVLPFPSSQLIGIMAPSTVSLADGIGDQVTLASAIPGSTAIIGISFGQVRTGGSLSALIKRRECHSQLQKS